MNKIGNNSIRDRKEFIYAIGLALGMVLGFALCSMVMYHNAQDWAKSAVYNYTMSLPEACRPQDPTKVYNFSLPTNMQEKIGEVTNVEG